MAENKKPNHKDAIKSGINSIIEELCSKHDSEEIEADIVALFEDIVSFFSGREGDFINFENLSVDAKKAIYIEIKSIIALLKKLRKSTEKNSALKTLSKNMMLNMSTSLVDLNASFPDRLSKQEQEKVKKAFVHATLIELQKQRRQMLNKMTPSKDLFKKTEIRKAQRNKSTIEREL